MNNKDFLAEVEATIAYYEQANGYMARRTRQMIAELGEVLALSQLMVSPDLQQGFKVLRDARQIDKTFEAVVVKHQHLFPPEIVAAAQWRLEHPDDLFI